MAFDGLTPVSWTTLGACLVALGLVVVLGTPAVTGLGFAVGLVGVVAAVWSAVQAMNAAQDGQRLLEEVYLIRARAEMQDLRRIGLQLQPLRDWVENPDREALTPRLRATWASEVRAIRDAADHLVLDGFMELELRLRSLDIGEAEVVTAINSAREAINRRYGGASFWGRR